MEIFLATFISLFVIVDPLGTSAVFLALTRKIPDKTLLKKIALQASFIATILLLFFGFFGQYLLHKMGISLDAFRIAGGLLIFVTAFRMIMGFHQSDSIDSKDGCYKDLSNIAVFPLAIPLLSGPGCMTAVILNMNNAPDFESKLIIVLAILFVECSAFFCMIFSSKIITIVGETASGILARLMGIILAALAVQFVADGITNIVKEMLHTPV